MADNNANIESKSSFKNGSCVTSNNGDIGNCAQNGDANNVKAKTVSNVGQISSGSDDKDRARHSSGESSTGSSSFVKLERESISENRIASVMERIRDKQYSPSDVMDNLGLHDDCLNLYRRDYDVETVDNPSGYLSLHYPLQLMIPVGRQGENSAIDFHKETYAELAYVTSVIRSRARFIAPVMLVGNKFICRSGTVGNRVTHLYETLVKRPPPPKTEYVSEGGLDSGFRFLSNFKSFLDNASEKVSEATAILWESADEMYERLRKDAELLRLLKIEHICDFMVEKEKLVLSEMLPVSSSEKALTEVYNDFRIQQMPYPGCEFFKDYHNAGRKPEGLVFNWDVPQVTVDFLLSEDANVLFPGIEWNKFKEWDLVELTKNYMKVLLTYVARDSCSLLIHCISGWDRTPLFISLLRVSLWADGVIHESLNTLEMAFLTLTYDWYLFGHHLPDRLNKDEEVMHFCFNFMQYIASDDFSVTRIFHELPSEQKHDFAFPEFRAGARSNKMIEVGSLLLRTYDNEILKKFFKREPVITEEVPMESEE